jgi:hypothetical protein
MAISEQDRQVLQANEGHMLTAKDGWVQQVYDLTKLHEIYERNVAHYPLTTWCPSCVIKFMQRLGTWWDGVKQQPEPTLLGEEVVITLVSPPHTSQTKQKRRK